MTGAELTELALKAGAGDAEALERIIALVSGRVHSQVGRAIPPDDIEDVEQCIYESLCRSIGKFAGESSFDTWFARVKRNKIADYYRLRERRRGGMEKFLELHPEKAFYEMNDDIEFADFSRRFLRTVPKQYRDSIRLCFIEGHKIEEAAQIMGYSYDGVRSNYRRGLAWCRAHLHELWLS